MKLNKKAVTLMSFVLGGVIFVSTAFADVALGSGYEKLKSSLKNTTAKMSKGLDNYTIESSILIKDNGRVLYQKTDNSKADNKNKAAEVSSISKNSDGKITSHYSYEDSKTYIYKNSESEDKYYVSEFSSRAPRTTSFGMRDPFDRKNSNEIEKIFDAALGSLKDYVQVEELPDGKKQYSGSITEAQVPGLINAVASYGFKQIMEDERRSSRNTDYPIITSEMYVKKVAGRAVENQSGLLESLLAEVSVTGNDKSGFEHEISFEFVGKLTGVGNTQVSAPDLSGKSVEKVKRYSGWDDKSIGKYKNDIIMEKDGKYVKIGERLIEISQVSDEKVTGRYYEVYKPGFENITKEKYNFNFEIDPFEANPTITYNNSSGQKESARLHRGSPGKMYLELGVVIIDNNSYSSKSSRDITGTDKVWFDNQFYMIFAD